MMFGEGKTAHQKNMLGRVMQHVDVKKRPISALELWL